MGRKTGMNKNQLSQAWKTLIVGQDQAIDKIAPYLIRAQANLNAPGKPIGVFFLMGPTGTGKALPMDELVATPDGFTRNRDLIVGSTVIGQNGLPTTVEAVYPQGVVDIYRITFADGRAVECCGNHLWKVYSKYWKPNPSYKSLSLLEIKRSLGINPKREFHVPLCLPVQRPTMVLPIEPYLLGALLGDGSLHKTMGFSNADPLIILAVNKALGACGAGLVDYNGSAACDYGIALLNNTHTRDTTSIRHQLRELDLFEKNAWEKFIPTIYKNSSIDQRIKLLQGLMDTDGTAGKNGSISFTSTSRQLAEDVQFLVWSLGGYAKLVSTQKFFTYKGVRKSGRLAYRVNIRFTTPEMFFTIEEKQRRASKNVQYRNRLRLKIQSIEYVGKKEAQCITVDNSDSLYLTRNYVVTHNTKTAESLAELLHGSEKNILRVDCGEYQMEHEVAKMIGAPPGYLGHKETQPLFTQQKINAIASEKCPFSIILFDEIEKSHPGVWRAILGILDKAILRLGDNSIVNFEKCVIFLSSNVGAKEIGNLLVPGFGFQKAQAINEVTDVQQKAIEKIGAGAMKRKFPPEFANRIDETITYRSLDRDALTKITELELNKIKTHIQDRLGATTFTFSYEQDTVEFLTTAGTSLTYGARELKRTLGRLILNPLADEFVEGKIAPYSLVKCKVANDRIEWDIQDAPIEVSPQPKEVFVATVASASVTSKKTRKAKISY